MEKLRSQFAEAAAKAKEEAAYVFSEELAKAKELKAATAKLKEVASSSIGSAKQRVASVGLNGATRSYLLGQARGGTHTAADDDTLGDEATAEKERLVDGGGSSSAEDKLRTGLAAASAEFGSCIGALRAAGVMGMPGIGQPGEGKAVPASVSSLEGARSAGDVARSASERGLSSGLSSGLSGLRSAREVGSAACHSCHGACSSGVGRLIAATDLAKEATQDRCGEAFSAASAVSGVSLRSKEEQTRLERLCGLCLCGPCPELSYRQRLGGVVSCMSAGLLLSLSSLLSFTQLILGNPLPFALKYTAGNLLSLGSTAFLVGPMRQARSMLAPSRRAASLVYVASLACTLLSTLLLRLLSLSLLFILMQMLALGWYTLSYVPYGQAAAKSLVRRVLRRVGVALPSGGSTARVYPASLSALRGHVAGAGEGSSNDT